jgi:hypothetical protein
MVSGKSTHMIPQNPVEIDRETMRSNFPLLLHGIFFGGQLEFDPGLLDCCREAGTDTIKYAGRG